jgi:hypothetical protein
MIHSCLLEIEELALEDEYFKSNLASNVDFYSGIIYRAFRIPTDMFTVMFAIWITVKMLQRARKTKAYMDSVERF